MTTLKSRLTDAMKDAMRSQAKERLGVIRLMLADLKRVEVDERIELSDERVVSILQKMLKQRRESIAQFSKAGRDDLVKQEEFEVAVIQEFLPQMLSEEELKIIVHEAISALGITSIKDMGKLMAAVKPKCEGRADMSMVSAIIKSILQP